MMVTGMILRMMITVNDIYDNKDDDKGDLYDSKDDDDESLEVEVESPCASPQAAAAGCEFLRKYQLMLEADFLS